MGYQYEADKIIQLLQFCSWKAHTTMNHTGLIELTIKLGELPGDKEKYPNEKYLVDLLSDARSAIKQDNILRKRKSYIDLLLEYSGHKSWKDWTASLYGSREYFQSAIFEATLTQQTKIAVLTSESLGKQLHPTLVHIQKTIPYLLDIFVYNQEIAEKEFKQKLPQLGDYDVIIWSIPISMAPEVNQMKNPTWQELIKSAPIIPIWIDRYNAWETEPPFISFLKPKEVLGGIPGILCSILLIHDYSQSSETLKESESGHHKPASGILHFHDNSSGFINQGNIQNQNNTVQTITNYHSKD